MNPSPSTADPLILTLAFDPGTGERFDGLRRRHFPEALNRIPAHATLFHHLDGLEEAEVAQAIREATRDEPMPEVAVTGLRFTGRGVAYVLESPALSAVRARLAARFDAMLTNQDRQGWRPHVTVQNKVAPQVARALHERLNGDFAPLRFIAPGLILWRYLGGPWSHRASFPFGQHSPHKTRSAP
ncbi:2'-5' RNA ligase family protein [Methylobacterium sp. Leaf108]|uniref:2'-5' RNA ligase family protein n=1 Tax=Methylobacterium sp. Leaf108 TaxID=1736256 RepID=UPI0006FA7B00|nr:2'-5' RNA ligase family protein [Methylobacterium sp. Leaf108]KQP50246.1 phosphoesterase HXTX [Methylobacterium sp. Leaf108]